jgi:hypothetical protein
MKLIIEIDQFELHKRHKRGGMLPGADALELYPVAEFAAYRDRDGKRLQLFRYRLEGSPTTKLGGNTVQAVFVSPLGGCTLDEIIMEMMPDAGTIFRGRWKVLVDDESVDTPKPPPLAGTPTLPTPTPAPDTSTAAPATDNASGAAADAA